MLLLQMLAVPSSDAVNIDAPSGEKWAENVVVCPIVSKQIPIQELQILAVMSDDVVNINDPSGEKTAERTSLVCPATVRRESPVAEFQILGVLSSGDKLSTRRALCLLRRSLDLSWTLTFANATSVT